MGKSGVQAGDLLLLMAQNLDVLAGPLISLAYPLYASIRAIETRHVADDQQWLTYWVLYSMITLFELTFEKLIEWIPYWSYVKLATTCWLVIPQFSGAAFVYQNYIRPFYVRNMTVDDPITFKKDAFTPSSIDDSDTFKKDVFMPSQDEIHVAAHPNYGVDGYPNIFQPGLQSDIDREVKYRGNTFFSEGHDDYVY